ncbi:MAG TPA: ParB/RepB/Spo0J family partition protein [Candidatus Dormibacteraeota bacterium]|jgi:ParB family chromosome partitioning protein
MSAIRPRGLGRGLHALIPLPTGPGGGSSRLLALDQIRPSPEQMRRHFPADSLRELADSIREHGILQPVLVRPLADGYELIAGERRWRAARQAGLERIPAVVREEAADDESLLLGLVENLQREDLDPIEEARGIQRLIDQFGLTQEEAATRLGRGRVSVNQALVLLRACPAVASATASGAISAAHARSLIGLPTPEDQERGLRVVLARRLNVRQTENWARSYRPAPSRAPRSASVPPVDALAQRLAEALGAPVRISGAARGRITIEFISRRQLEGIVSRLTR